MLFVMLFVTVISLFVAGFKQQEGGKGVLLMRYFLYVKKILNILSF